MNANDLPADATAQALAADLLAPLLQGPTQSAPTSAVQAVHGVVIGELIALAGDGATALVRYPGQSATGALHAPSTVDLQAADIGAAVLLSFIQADPSQPVVVGRLRGRAGWPLEDKPAQVEVDADGQRLVLNAREQLVLRCGKASITLTKAGKVLIEGAYVLSRSTGVNRVKGGSVQLN